MKKSIFVVLCACAMITSCGTEPKAEPKPMANSPVALNPAEWVFVDALSDEFNADKLDTSKWQDSTSSWGPWSWRQRHAKVEDGSLKVFTDYEKHTRGDRQLFYTSGIVQSKAEFTYGYMEASIKGCEVANGVCPAFWVRGSVKTPVDSVYYSEIDIVELQQSKDLSLIDCNLHTRVGRDGEIVWVRPKQRPDLCGNVWDAEWDPRDDYHVYACESTPDHIRWFIDGELVAEQPNIYWHLPMITTFSMGLRAPLIEYVDDDRIPVEEASTPEGFPTSMKVDYIRTWVRK